MATLNIPIAAGTDDATEASNGLVTTTGFNLGNDLDATTEWVGLRFRNVTIPKGSIINSASISVVPTGSTTDEPLVTMYGEDIDDAPAFVNGTTNTISSRTRTTASVVWSSTNLGAPSPPRYSSPSLTTIIQEIVDRVGWASGNALNILIQGGSSSFRDLRFWAFELGSDFPELDIDYTPPTPVMVGIPADIEFEGFPSTQQAQFPAGAPVDIQFEGLSSTFTMQVAAGATGDIQFTGFATTPVATLQAGASAAVVWEGFPTLVVVATITCDPRTLEETLAGRYGPVAIRHRFEWLDRNLVTVADISRAIEYARVQLDNNRAIMRTCQMRIRPARLPSDFGTEDDHIAVYAEVNVAGEWQRLPLGVFHLDYVAERLLPNGNEIWEAQGVDLSSHLYESEISETFVLPAGTNYVEAVAAICVSVGLGTNIEPSTYVTPARFVWPPGSSRGNIANDLLRGINYYPFWATAQGAIRSREWLDPYAEPPAVTYSTNEQPKMIRSSGLTRIRERARFVNRAIVTIADPGRAPATVQVTNDDQDSIVSTVNKGAVMVQNVIGDRIVDTAMMAAVGASLVRDAGVKAQGATFQSFPDPRRDAHEFYTLVIDDREDSTPWRVESWDYECKPGTAMIHRIARASRIDVTTEVLV